MNLWIWTEERPKKEVLALIVKKLCKDKGYCPKISEIKIVPETKEKRFTFRYLVRGIEIPGIEKIYLKVVSGYGSFVDYLVFVQDTEPNADSIPLYAIEETKTDDSESRNTGVYQRCSKFVYIEFYYPTAKKIMLYNLKVSPKKPTETNIFGTRMLLTLGVEILGKELDENVFKKFGSIDELIDFKNRMRRAPRGNVPILIRKQPDKITISGRLYKSGGLSHDPNIGALSLISKTLRQLGWGKDIVITQHGLSQSNIGSSNKFIKIANQISIKLDGLSATG